MDEDPPPDSFQAQLGDLHDKIRVLWIAARHSMAEFLAKWWPLILLWYLLWGAFWFIWARMGAWIGPIRAAGARKKPTSRTLGASPSPISRV